MELASTIRGRTAESELVWDSVPDRVLALILWVAVLDLLSAEEPVRTEDVSDTELILLFVVLELLSDRVLVSLLCDPVLLELWLELLSVSALDPDLDSDFELLVPARVVLDPVLLDSVRMEVLPDCVWLVFELVSGSVLVPVWEEVL